MKFTRVLFFSVFFVAMLLPTNAFARSLYNGLEGSDVTTLQETLIAHGYLAEGYATGYFGSLTQAAVQKFQCAHNIVCSGGISNGFGVYGPQTQATLATVTNNPVNPARLTGDMTPAATGDFEVSGWIPYWRQDKGIKDASKHLSKLTSVMPFGYTMKTNGTIADTAEISKHPWPSFISKAEKKDVLVVPTVMWGNGDLIHETLRNTAKREALEQEIANEVEKHDFDGIDIDFEAKKHETINYFSMFLKGLREKMGDKLIYCAIESRMPLENRYLPGMKIPDDATYRANDYVEINKYCDRIEVMTYDQGRVDLSLNKKREEPYAPVSDNEWAESVIRLVAQTIDRDKLVLGIPTYGYGWEVTPIGNGEYSYKRLWAFNPAYALDVAEKLGIKPARTSAGEMGFTYDARKFESLSENHRGPRRARIDAWAEMEKGGSFTYVTWSDAEAIEDKVDLAKKLGLRGVAVFKFDGSADPDMWDALD